MNQDGEVTKKEARTLRGRAKKKSTLNDDSDDNKDAFAKGLHKFSFIYYEASSKLGKKDEKRKGTAAGDRDIVSSTNNL